jgi:hypothetical protein
MPINSPKREIKRVTRVIEQEVKRMNFVDISPKDFIKRKQLTDPMTSEQSFIDFNLNQYYKRRNDDSKIRFQRDPGQTCYSVQLREKKIKPVYF